MSEEKTPEVQVLDAANVDYRQVAQYTTDVKFISDDRAIVRFAGFKVVEDPIAVDSLRKLLPAYEAALSLVNKEPDV